MCKNEGFPEENQKTPSNFIFYPEVCHHLLRYSPENLKKLGRVVLYKVIEKMTKCAKMIFFFRKKSENPFKFYFLSKSLLPPTMLLSWEPKKSRQGCIIQSN